MRASPNQLRFVPSYLLVVTLSIRILRCIAAHFLAGMGLSFATTLPDQQYIHCTTRGAIQGPS